MKPEEYMSVSARKALLLSSSSHHSLSSTTRSVQSGGSKPPLPTGSRGTQRQNHAVRKHEDSEHRNCILPRPAASTAIGNENRFPDSSSSHSARSACSEAGHNGYGRPSDYLKSPRSVSSGKRSWTVKIPAASIPTPTIVSVPLDAPTTPPRNRKSIAEICAHTPKGITCMSDQMGQIGIDDRIQNCVASTSVRGHDVGNEIDEDSMVELEDGALQASANCNSGASASRREEVVSRQDRGSCPSIPDTAANISRGSIYETPRRSEEKRILLPNAVSVQRLSTGGLLDTAIADLKISSSLHNPSIKDGAVPLETVRPLAHDTQALQRRQVHRTNSAPSHLIPPSPSAAKEWSKKKLMGSMDQLPPAFRTSKKIGPVLSPARRRRIDVTKLEKIVHVRNRKDVTLAPRKLKRRWPPVEVSKETPVDHGVVPRNVVKSIKPNFEIDYSLALLSPERTTRPVCWTGKSTKQNDLILKLSPGSAVSEITDMIDTGPPGGSQLQQTSLKICWSGPTYLKGSSRPLYFDDILHDELGNEIPLAGILETRLDDTSPQRYEDWSDDEGSPNKVNNDSINVQDSRGSTRTYRRPDIWITPASDGVFQSGRKWRMRRVWNFHQIDDCEIDYEVDESHLLEKVKQLLGIPTGNYDDQDSSISPVYSPDLKHWKVKKVYDVDGQILRKSKTKNMTEQGVVSGCIEIFREATSFPATPIIQVQSETDGKNDRITAALSRQEVTNPANTLLPYADEGTAVSSVIEGGANGTWISKSGRLKMEHDNEWSAADFTQEPVENGPGEKTNGRTMIDGDSMTDDKTEGKWVIKDDNEHEGEGDSWNVLEEHKNQFENTENPQATDGRWTIGGSDEKERSTGSWDVEEERRIDPVDGTSRKTRQKVEEKKKKNAIQRKKNSSKESVKNGPGVKTNGRTMIDGDSMTDDKMEGKWVIKDDNKHEGEGDSWNVLEEHKNQFENRENPQATDGRWTVGGSDEKERSTGSWDAEEERRIDPVDGNSRKTQQKVEEEKKKKNAIRRKKNSSDDDGSIFDLLSAPGTSQVFELVEYYF